MNVLHFLFDYRQNEDKKLINDIYYSCILFWHAPCFNQRMTESVNLLGSLLLGQQKALTTIADNVANIDTGGFKRLIHFDYLQDNHPQFPDRVGDYPRMNGIVADFSQGGMEQTNNPLDLAINGDAFFAVDDNGTITYTRNGQFNLTQDGSLVDERNNPVLDDGGAPIAIPAEAAEIKVTADGTISTEEGPVANIGLFRFTPEAQKQLQRAGYAGYRTPDGVQPAPALDNFTVLQGNLETSNVNGVSEIVKLQELNQAYNGAQRTIQRIEELEQRAIRTLARPPQ